VVSWFSSRGWKIYQVNQKNESGISPSLKTVNLVAFGGVLDLTNILPLNTFSRIFELDIAEKSSAFSI